VHTQRMHNLINVILFCSNNLTFGQVELNLHKKYWILIKRLIHTSNTSVSDIL